MTPARRIPSLLAWAAWLALLAAPAPARAAASPPRPSAPTARHGAPGANGVRRTRAAADTSARARSRVAPRTLDDIHIEGEIPVPQVLFITARDQRRFMEFQHHRYLRTSVDLGRATPTPTRVIVPAPAPAERKENPR